MISLWLITAHFVGDFLLQSNWMALGKSKRIAPLTIHCLVYSACFLFWGWRFALLTFWLHFLVDYFTSKATSKLWFITLKYPTLEPSDDGFRYNYAAVDDRKRHWFFVMIGLDQLLHYFALHATWHLIFGA